MIAKICRGLPDYYTNGGIVDPTFDNPSLMGDRLEGAQDLYKVSEKKVLVNFCEVDNDPWVRSYKTVMNKISIMNLRVNSTPSCSVFLDSVFHYFFPENGGRSARTGLMNSTS